MDERATAPSGPLRRPETASAVARGDPRRERLVALQRAVGNRALARMLQPVATRDVSRAVAITSPAPVRRLLRSNGKTGTAAEHDGNDARAAELGHAAHTLHEVHAAAEGLEFASHLGHYAQHYHAALATVRGHAQLAQEIRLMQRKLSALQHALDHSVGRNVARRTKVLRQISELKTAHQAAESAYKAQKPGVSAANLFLREANKLKGVATTTPKGRALLRLGKAASRLEVALKATAAGRNLLRLGRFVSHPAFAKGLIGLGAAVEAVGGYIESPATTKGGKVANAALAGGGGALVMINPFVAVADLLLPHGVKPSEHYRGTASGVATLGEAAVLSIVEGPASVSTAGLEDFHERSKSGRYGKVMQVSSEAGDYWADEGIVGGLTDFGREFWNWL